MCNLYTTKARAAEIAAAFKAQLPINFNAGEGDVYPGGQGMVVREAPVVDRRFVGRARRDGYRL